MLRTPYTIDGEPLLGTYAASTMEDLKLVERAGMNVVIGGREMLDPESTTGGFLHDNGIRVLHHLTRHIYGMPTLGDLIDPSQGEIPLSTRPARTLPSPGIVQLDDELIRYDEFTAAALKGCERGFGGTEPSAHNEGIFLFMPEECVKEIEEVKDSPNLYGYYVLDDSPGDALSALRAMYKAIWDVDGGASHHAVCAGYGSAGSLCNFAKGVCDLMLIYWYPVSASFYDRCMTGREVQWMLTEARSRVPAIPFVGVYQAYWGDGAAEPTPGQIREQAEDFVREGACGLIAFACRINHPLSGWADSEPLRKEIGRIHEEIKSTGGLEVRPEPETMASSRIQPTGFWEKPRRIAGLVPAWYVIGPFDDVERKGLDAEFPPERELKLDATYEGKFGPVHWIARDTIAGSVGLGEIYGNQRLTSHAVAYSACTISCPDDKNVLMKLGSDDDVLAWFNGKEVWRHEGTRGLGRDDDVVPLELPSGESRILLKVYNREGMWGFFLRFTDQEGRPLEGLGFSPPATR